MAARRSSPAPSPGSSRRCSCECSAPWMPSSARMTPPRVPGCAAITMPWAGRPWRSCANRRAWCARLTTWTPPALASEARRYSHELWRVVETQHTASTMRLTDSLEEQASLELVLEQSTPALAALSRQAHIQLIRYESVRDPEHAACAAVLDPAAFGRGKPHSQHTWFIAASRARVRCAQDERGGASWEFTREQLL